MTSKTEVRRTLQAAVEALPAGGSPNTEVQDSYAALNDYAFNTYGIVEGILSGDLRRVAELRENTPLRASLTALRATAPARAWQDVEDYVSALDAIEQLVAAAREYASTSTP